MPKTQTNVQKMDAALAQLKQAQIDGKPKPRLLLHACCAPCSSYVLELLHTFFEVHIYFYNPNIWPKAEHDRRALELERFLGSAYTGEITLTQSTFLPEDFYSAISGYENEPERGARCKICYKLRMEHGAKYAKTNGFDYYATTLSISPHKNANWINELGEEISIKYGIPHLPSDFKKHGGYQRSLEISKEHGLYRQNYCGCEFSAKAMKNRNDEINSKKK